MLLLLWFPSQQVPAGKGRRGKTPFKFCRPTTSTAVMSGIWSVLAQGKSKWSMD